MRTYRIVWFSLAGVAGVLGAWLSLEKSAGGSLILLLCVMATTGAVAMAATHQVGRARWRLARDVAATWGAVVVTAAGLLDVLGTAGFGLLALLAATSPPVLTRALRWSGYAGGSPDRHGDGPSTSDGEPDADPTFVGTAVPAATSQSPAPGGLGPAVAPASLDGPGLCLAWRQSFVVLQRAASPTSRMRILLRRQELLDEFERRNALGFAAWLASGARAAGDPSKYVLPAPRVAERHPQREEGSRPDRP